MVTAEQIIFLVIVHTFGLTYDHNLRQDQIGREKLLYGIVHRVLKSRALNFDVISRSHVHTSISHASALLWKVTDLPSIAHLA